MKLEIYKVNRTQDWRWRVTARNGRIVAASSEGFATRGGAKRNLMVTLRHLVRLLDSHADA